MNENSSTSQNPGLHSFGGSPTPTLVSEGIQILQEMAGPSRTEFWELLETVIRNPGDSSHGDRIGGFSHEHDLPNGRVVEALQASETLLHQAAAFDLDRDRFAQDLAALSDLHALSLDPLLPLYDGLKGELRGRILGDTLTDHGKVLLGLDWRVDNVLASDRGVDLQGTVLMLTLRYQEGERIERITLQLTPDALAELKRFAQRIEG